MDITLAPIGFVHGGRTEALDDDWGRVESRIELDATRFTPDALSGLGEFSHLLVISTTSTRPIPARPNTAHGIRAATPLWPKVGIFAQRGKDRPNHLGVSICEILAVEGLTVRVRGLDALDGTPVLDLKPCMQGFEPGGTPREPACAREIMTEYW